jgi:hypothetical protein
MRFRRVAFPKLPVHLLVPYRRKSGIGTPESGRPECMMREERLEVGWEVYIIREAEGASTLMFVFTIVRIMMIVRFQYPPLGLFSIREGELSGAYSIGIYISDLTVCSILECQDVTMAESPCITPRIDSCRCCIYTSRMRSCMIITCMRT